MRLGVYSTMISHGEELSCYEGLYLMTLNVGSRVTVRVGLFLKRRVRHFSFRVSFFEVDRIWDISGSCYDVPKAIFYLLKLDYS